MNIDEYVSRFIIPQVNADAVAIARDMMANHPVYSARKLLRRRAIRRLQWSVAEFLYALAGSLRSRADLAQALDLTKRRSQS